MLKGQKKYTGKDLGKTKHEAPRSVNYSATQDKNNVGTTASNLPHPLENLFQIFWHFRQGFQYGWQIIRAVTVAFGGPHTWGPLIWNIIHYITITFKVIALYYDYNNSVFENEYIKN